MIYVTRAIYGYYAIGISFVEYVLRRMHILINPLRSKFFRRNINIYLHFVSFLPVDKTQVVEILPQIRQEPTYST